MKLPDPTKHARQPKSRFARSRFGPVTTTLDDDSITAVGPNGQVLIVHASVFVHPNPGRDELRQGVEFSLDGSVVGRLIQPEFTFARQRRAIHIDAVGDDRFPVGAFMRLRGWNLMSLETPDRQLIRPPRLIPLGLSGTLVVDDDVAEELVVLYAAVVSSLGRHLSLGLFR